MREAGGAYALSLVALLLAFVMGSLHKEAPPPHPSSPQIHRENGYVGSGACRSCHPSEHASWSKTYHRTMTRQARDLTWDGEKGPLLPARLALYDRDFLLTRSGDTTAKRIHYRGPDLHAIGRALVGLARAPHLNSDDKRRKSEELFRTAPEVERELVLTTGSHHYVAFWVEGGNDAELRQLPFVYLLDEARWLPRKDAFIQPPDALPHLARWNAGCIQCHTVAGRPAQTEGTDEASGEFWERYETTVAEEGISCEACHGPGREHSDHYRNPLARLEARRKGTASHIFVPSPEQGALASAACGQCHSYFVPSDPGKWWTSGFSENFMAGEELSHSRSILRAEPNSEEETHARGAIDHDLQNIFWSDGSIIVGGREYNGLTLSPCFVQGVGERKLACTSCHSMHQGDPDRQMRPDLSSDALCTQCHDTLGADHTRHDPESPGARCVNCHMPRTSYALLHGIPSHQIQSPTAQVTSPPHACTLCHVDRDEQWLLRELEHFGISSRTPPSDSRLPVAVVGALSGNAAERAIYAYALGTEEALVTAGRAVPEAVLAELQDDPYPAIRWIAKRSLQNVKSHPFSQRRKFEPTPRPWIALDPASLDDLASRRDNTPIFISE
jgi:predicted CXXCH cytochrome family protein